MFMCDCVHVFECEKWICVCVLCTHLFPLVVGKYETLYFLVSSEQHLCKLLMA